MGDGPAGRAFEIFAVASFGGHLEELLELRQAWAGRSCLYVTTRPDTVRELTGERVTLVQDCHAGQVFKAVRCLAQFGRLFLTHRPKFLVTTGALPGLMAALAARVAGARVIWIDSVANSQTLSASGRQAVGVVHHHFSQWPDVAARDGSTYGGSLF